MSDERETLARIIWETSRADEGTISATGANIIANAILARFRGSPTPERVTEEQVERMARSRFALTFEGRNGHTWPISGDWRRQRDLDDARRALIHVLGGGSK